MTRIAQADEDAFRLLVRRYQNLIYSTIVRMLGNYDFHEAEDLAQQVFIKVYRAAPRYRPTARFTTWLLTICRNCVFTHTKQRNRWKWELLNFDEESKTPPSAFIAEAQDDPFQRELANHIQLALNQLPEKQRLALVLRQYDHLDYEQIAEVLETSVSSVKSLLFRGRETLRAILKEYLA